MWRMIVPVLLVAATPGKDKESERFKSNNTFVAQVVTVTQGDTVSVNLEGDVISVRLAEVDAPDIRQSFGRQARHFTEELVKRRTVKVVVRAVDVHKRVIGEVFLPDGRSVNYELVRWGYAWHYRVTPVPSKALAQLEYEAWKKKLGLWLDPEPVPPWQQRSDRHAKAPPPSPSSMDYDDIFDYGLVGSRSARTYQWPACKDYAAPPREDLVVFSNKLEAESLGFRAVKGCPRE